MALKINVKQAAAPKIVAKLLQSSSGPSPDLQTQGLETEDVFIELIQNGVVLAPPFDPFRLARMVVENNTLAQSIDIMEVNIDGTGYSIVPTDTTKDAENDPIIKSIEEFLETPWPGKSFSQLKRDRRRDLETYGYSFIEVIRNAAKEIVFLRHISSSTMRLMKLTDPKVVPVTIIRKGVEITLNVPMRFRGFVQSIGEKNFSYFKEFGAVYDINCKTGEWAEPNTLGFTDKGNEILYETVNKDSFTPYGLPRWINQIPSVIGSRKAEELNLDYFEAGGIPPVLVMVSGGNLTDDTEQALKAIFSGGSKTRGAVLSATPSGGSIDSTGNVRLQVERFGSEKQNDSLYENYDEKCSKRISSSFRLPPLFYGRADDYSFASAMTSVLVAETQVFTPERKESDDLFTRTIIKDLVSSSDYKIVSNAVSLTDIENQFKGLELVKDSIAPEEMVKLVATMTNLALQFSEEDYAAALERDKPIPPVIQGAGPVKPGTPPKPGTPVKPQSVRKWDEEEVIALAKTWASMIRTKTTKSAPDSLDVRFAISKLGAVERAHFDDQLALELWGPHVNHDSEGAHEISAAISEMA